LAVLYGGLFCFILFIKKRNKNSAIFSIFGHQNPGSLEMLDPDPHPNPDSINPNPQQ
jgi:hypothetical protein